MDWVERVTGERVVASRPLPGGTWGGMTALTLASGRALVLRVVRPDLLAEEPDIVAREAAALDLLATSGLPVPRLVAHDGDRLLMTFLDGTPDLRDPRIEATRALAERVHEVVAPQGFAAYGRYYEGAEPPGWASDAGVWRAASDVARERAPAYEPVLIHRDLHPLNLLWSGGTCTGLVDWTSACRGPAAVDAAHCKANLAILYGPDIALRWPNDSYWDVVAVTDLAPDLTNVATWHAFGRTDLTLPLALARLEAYLARVAC